MIKKIISGGQTGADMGGLLAGKALGLETGGTCPANWKTELGSNLDLRNYGLKCSTSNNYSTRTRTRINIIDSDGTVIFGNINSRGSQLTSEILSEMEYPMIHISYNNFDITDFRIWMLDNSIEILNVAGNRASVCLGMESFVKDFLVKALSD